MPVYLALGDSMSIDDYTGVPGGGAVRQFFRTLGDSWTLDDHTMDGCRMDGVPREARGDLITLTIGGNDLLCEREFYLKHGWQFFARRHLDLLRAIRQANPESLLIVGDIYEPQDPLPTAEREALTAVNRAIADNCRAVDARLAPIHRTFLGKEASYLCLQIEPTLKGATAIADLFRQQFEARSSTE